MKERDSILIVTDEAPQTRACALGVVTELFGRTMSTVKASAFSGTDILGADICVLGCAQVNPPEFAHFENVLRHINLTLRRCVLFSPESQAEIDYLAALVRDSGIHVLEPPLTGATPLAIKTWIRAIIS